MKTFFKLFCKELKLNLKDMNMILFAIIMPLTIFVIFGCVYKDKLAFSTANYTFLEQSFGAISAISILAGGLMGLPILISEYRERKILKRFKVTPISPVTLLIVELTIYILYCIVSVISLLFVGIVFFDMKIHGSIILFLGAFLLTMVSTLSIGLFVGGIASNSKSAGVITSIMYFPMLILSGTTIPLEKMPDSLEKCVRVLPLTQGIKLMKITFLDTNGNVWLPVLVMSMVTILFVSLAIKLFKWE